MSYNTLPELFPEEKKMPLAKYYYNYPVHDLGPIEKQILAAGPMNAEKAIRPENFLDLYKPVGEYDEIEMGYCMYPDGSGYVATYTRIPPDIEIKENVLVYEVAELSFQRYGSGPRQPAVQNLESGRSLGSQFCKLGGRNGWDFYQGKPGSGRGRPQV